MARPKLNESQVAHIMLLWKKTEMNQTAVANLFRVSPGVIAKVLDGTYKPRPDDEQQKKYNVELARRILHDAINTGSPEEIDKAIDELILAVTRECAG